MTEIDGLGKRKSSTTSRSTGHEHGGFLRTPVLEEHGRLFDAKNVSIPAAMNVFPHEIHKAPRSRAERAYTNPV